MPNVQSRVFIIVGTELSRTQYSTTKGVEVNNRTNRYINLPGLL